jgi:ferric-dicitrate binding protein FerR (iron transport regulator)
VYNTFTPDEQADAASAFAAIKAADPDDPEAITAASQLWTNTRIAIEERRRIQKRAVGSPAFEDAQRQLEHLRAMNDEIKRLNSND